MTDGVRLGEWIAGLRRELTEAVLLQEGREAAARVEDRALAVPQLRLKDLKLELEVTTSLETEDGGGGKMGAKMNLGFFVVTGEISSSTKERPSSKATQRVTLVLQPHVDMFLGEADEKETLHRRPGGGDVPQPPRQGPLVTSPSKTVETALRTPGE